MEYQQINPTSFIVSEAKIAQDANTIFYNEFKALKNKNWLIGGLTDNEITFVVKDVLSTDIINKCQCVNCLELAYQILTIEF